MAVIKCSLNGCRNFPLFIPSMITPTQTAYAVNATIESYTASQAQNFVNSTPVLFIQTYTSAGAISLPWTACPIPCSVANTAAWASAIDTWIPANIVDPIAANLTCAASTTIAGALEFGLSPVNGFYSLAVGIVGRTPAQTLTDAVAYGFPNLPLSSPPSSYIQSMGGSSSITMPNAAFYVLPTLINTASSTQYLQWRSQTGYPLPPDLSTVNLTPAYWCLDYEWFCGIFNTALQTAVGSAASAAAAATNVVTSVQLPVLSHDSSSHLFSLAVDQNVTPPPNGTVLLNYIVLRISLNPMLSDLMQFPATYTIGGVATLNPAALKTTTTGLSWVSSFVPTASLWSPVDSLVFMTNNIPIRSEITTAPNPLGASTANATVNTAYGSLPIITDVTPVQSDAADWRATNTLFQPTVLRWTDLPSGAIALRSLNFSLGWRNAQSGLISNVQLNPNANFTVKLLFKKIGVPFGG
jgi:hypothetical protein